MQDKALIDIIANRKASPSPSQLAAWQNALGYFPDLPPEAMDPLLPALPSPEATRMLGRFIARELNPVQAVQQFLQQVDESNESIEEWLKAFEIFAYFIESTAHRPTLGQAIGYLHCCASMAHSGSRYATFPMAVETMLETYGYTGEGA